MESKEYIGKMVTVKMDRPFGTVSGDGEELDAYVLGEHKPLDTFEGRVIAVVHRLDDDDKLVVMADGRNYTDDQINALVEFQEK